MNIRNKKGGFTLVEILIYTGILGVTGAILTGVLLNATKIKGRQTAVIEVNNQLNFALQNIQRSITDSSVIDIASGSATSTLVLKYKDEAKNPTQFYVADGILYKKEGQNDPQPVTDDKVVVDAANFLKVSGYSGHDSVQIDLTLRYNSLSPDSSFSKTLSSAIARVSAATFDSNLVPGADNFYDVGISSTKWKDMYLSGSMYLTGTASKIGVGTASPSAKIHNLVTSRATTFSAGDGSTWHDLIIQNPNNTLNAATGIAFELNSAYHSNAGTGIAAVKSTASSDYGADMVFVTRPQSAAATEKMRITSAGNVGIGTSAPTSLLHLQTLGGDSKITLDAYSTNNGHTGYLMFRRSLQSTVGYTANNTGSWLGVIDFQGVKSDNSGFAMGARILATQDGTAGASYVPTALSFYTSDGSTSHAERMRISKTGNVGIGTTTPSYKLDVNGTVNATEFYKDGVAFAGGSGIPGNAVVPFNQVSCPTGWILADGSAGTPDLRGMFIRGSGTNASRTMANGSYYTATYGAYQDDAFQGHYHNLSYAYTSLTGGSGPDWTVRDLHSGFTANRIREPISDGTNGTPRTSTETRPANYAMIYCVKTTEDTESSNSIWGTVGNSVVLNDSGKALAIPGTVVQTVINTSTVTSSLNVTTFTEPNSAYRISITPKLANSKIIVEYNFSINAAMAANTVFHMQLVRNIGGTEVPIGVGPTSGSRNLTSWVGRPGNGYDTNDLQNVYMIAVDSGLSAGSTYTYGFKYRRESGGSGTAYFNYSYGDSSAYGWSGVMTMKATEIAQ